jgi:hypothetical protein
MPSYDETKKKWRAIVKKDGQRFQALRDTKAEAVKWEVEKKEELLRIQTLIPEDTELRIFFSKYLDHAELRFTKKV